MGRLVPAGLRSRAIGPLSGPAKVRSVHPAPEARRSSPHVRPTRTHSGRRTTGPSLNTGACACKSNTGARHLSPVLRRCIRPAPRPPVATHRFHDPESEETRADPGKSGRGGSVARLRQADVRWLNAVRSFGKPPRTCAGPCRAHPRDPHRKSRRPWRSCPPWPRSRAGVSLRRPRLASTCIGLGQALQ